MDPLDRFRVAGKRVTDPLETLAQRVAERVVQLVVDALDVNALLAQVDVNALLSRVDVAAVIDRVDLNELLARVDVDRLVEQTDLGAVLARSSGGVATEALDAARSQAVGLDQFIDGLVQRTLRRRQAAAPAPAALLDAQPPR
jgi:hypothetical protein